MTRSVPALLFLVLAACNTPGPEFRSAPVQRMSVNGSTFDIRHSGERAQAIRVNSESLPRKYETMAKAAVAIEMSSGCDVRRLDGEQSMAVAALACNATPRRPRPRPAAGQGSDTCLGLPVWNSSSADTFRHDCTLNRG